MLKLLLLFGSLTLKLLIVQANANGKLRCFRLLNETCPNPNITFWLYSHDEPLGHKIKLSAFQHDFDVATPLKVLLHDFGGNRDTSPNNEVRSQLISFRHLKILAVDYGRLVPVPCYTQAIHNVPYVGRCVAEFLANLMDNQLLLPQSLHIIGLGMGAHLANFVANRLKELHMRVGHITGLDPAKPLYIGRNNEMQLDASDADFVDIIHTDVFLYGLLPPVGHADFYPNMGITQPNCGPISDLTTHTCYHKRAAVYYAESIFSKENFWSFPCTDMFSFINGVCKPLDKFEVLGYHVSPFLRGIYFLATNGNAPYAKGKHFDNLDRSLDDKTYMDNSMAEKFIKKSFELQTN